MNREELVEEIASLILIVARHADDETVLAAEGAAMAIITLISQAIENGELKLPGEVGRYKLKDRPALHDFLTAMDRVCNYEYDLIALSPGGQEEER